MPLHVQMHTPHTHAHPCTHTHRGPLRQRHALGNTHPRSTANTDLCSHSNTCSHQIHACYTWPPFPTQNYSPCMWGHTDA